MHRKQAECQNHAVVIVVPAHAINSVSLLVDDSTCTIDHLKHHGGHDNIQEGLVEMFRRRNQQCTEPGCKDT